MGLFVGAPFQCQSSRERCPGLDCEFSAPCSNARTSAAFDSSILDSFTSLSPTDQHLQRLLLRQLPPARLGDAENVDRELGRLVS
jgi:hypothetical protein